jgi:hypothetical protein
MVMMTTTADIMLILQPLQRGTDPAAYIFSSFCKLSSSFASNSIVTPLCCEGCHADGQGRMDGRTDKDEDDGRWVVRDLDAL